MDPTVDVKTGIQTTEFWITIGNAVVNFVGVLLALIHPGFHLDPGVQAAVVAFAPLAAMGGVIFYSLSRAKVKAAALLPAPVVAAPAPVTNNYHLTAPTPPAADAVVSKEGETIRTTPRRTARSSRKAT